MSAAQQARIEAASITALAASINETSVAGLERRAGWNREGLGRGVSFHKRTGKYQVNFQIPAADGVKGKKKHVGYYDTPEEARAAHDPVAWEILGR